MSEFHIFLNDSEVNSNIAPTQTVGYVISDATPVFDFSAWMGLSQNAPGGFSDKKSLQIKASPK